MSLKICLKIRCLVCRDSAECLLQPALAGISAALRLSSFRTMTIRTSRLWSMQTFSIHRRVLKQYDTDTYPSESSWDSDMQPRDIPSPCAKNPHQSPDLSRSIDGLIEYHGNKELQPAASQHSLFCMTVFSYCIYNKAGKFYFIAYRQ